MKIDYSEEPLFQGYTTAEHYTKAGILFLEPMTAKEIDLPDDGSDLELLSSDYTIVEEKFDGTRGIFHILEEHNRLFSRRVSEKTGWLSENSDSVPLLRDMDLSELGLTVLDGELFIPGRPFKDVSGLLNCKYDKAIARQKELGNVVLHAFDILFFKGQDVRGCPLVKRKTYLDTATNYILAKYPEAPIQKVEWNYCSRGVPLQDLKPYEHWALKLMHKNAVYPYLYAERFKCKNAGFGTCLSARAYYDYVVLTGGEGVMVKDTRGKYYSKRGREYQKIKAFLTRDVVILGFAEPTKEYTGKFPSDHWDYWEYPDTLNEVTVTSNNFSKCSAKDLIKKGYTPVTKYYAKNQVGNVQFGVVVDKVEFEILKNDKKHKHLFVEKFGLTFLCIGECAGFNDDVRGEFTKYTENFIGKVIEVKANMLFYDTGKLRHPRFLRMRLDKNMEQCNLKDHLNS